MIREQRRLRKYRALPAGIIRAVSKTDVNSRKESIQSLMKMGKISDGWSTSGRRKNRSASTGSDASGLSELDHRLDDFSPENSRNHSLVNDMMFDSDEVSMQMLQSLCNSVPRKTNMFEESPKYRTPGNFYSSPRTAQNGNIVYYPYNRSKYVWTKPASDISGNSNSSQKADETVKEVSTAVQKLRSPFKNECADKVFESVCDNHIEILSLGWQWLKITVSIFNEVFHSCATIKDIEEYKNQCNKIEERMIFYIGASNFQSDCIPLSVIHQTGRPTKEIMLFVLLIHFALIGHDENAYKFLVGGIIGTMVYLFKTFKTQYPKENRINPRARGAGGDAGGAVSYDAAVVLTVASGASPARGAL